jgi:hypothetical protein
MLLFRSEEHLDRWLKDWNLPRGAVLSLNQCFRLAKVWYSPDRRVENWRRFTPDEAEKIFNDLGLTSAYWSLRA